MRCAVFCFALVFLAGCGQRSAAPASMANTPPAMECHSIFQGQAHSLGGFGGWSLVSLDACSGATVWVTSYPELHDAEVQAVVSVFRSLPSECGQQWLHLLALRAADCLGTDLPGGERFDVRHAAAMLSAAYSLSADPLTRLRAEAAWDRLAMQALVVQINGRMDSCRWDRSGAACSVPIASPPPISRLP